MIQLLAITAEQFQTVALAWLGALGIVAGALAVLLPKLKPVIQQVQELFRRTDAQNNRIESQQQQITQVALSTPPPAAVVVTNGEPQKVEVTNSPENPVQTEEIK